MTTFFHFTSTVHLPFIIGSGAIGPTSSNILFPSFEEAGPLVVWLLSEPEPTYEHGLVSAVDKTAVRFEVDIPAIKWTDWEWTARMPKDSKRLIIQTGGGEEAADLWYVWPAPIPRKRWVSVRSCGEPVAI